jgi:NTE family protein
MLHWPGARVSFRRNHRTEWVGGLLEKIAALPMLNQVDRGTLAAMASEFEWFSLPGGRVLFRQNDRDDSLYIVLSGRLGAFIRNEHDEESLIRQMVSGETVGEMAMLSAEPRSATVIALRDAELVRLSKSSFEKLVDRHPRTLRFITDLLVQRLRDAPRLEAPAAPPKTIAICPLERDVVSLDFIRSLTAAFEELGLKAATLDNKAAGQPAEWFNTLEAAKDVLLYQADFELTAWTRLCLRQADRLLLLADTAHPLAATPFALEAILANPLRAPVELVMFRGSQSTGQAQTQSVLARFNGFAHHYVREGVGRDFRRLARMVMGRAIGLVLSGGGARGIAHVGVIRALREAGLELNITT